MLTRPLLTASNTTITTRGGTRHFAGMSILPVPARERFARLVYEGLENNAVLEGLATAPKRRRLHVHVGNPLFTCYRKGVISIHPRPRVSAVAVLGCGSHVAVPPVGWHSNCSCCGASRRFDSNLR